VSLKQVRISLSLMMGPWGRNASGIKPVLWIKVIGYSLSVHLLHCINSIHSLF
jgi:hypothetical protein